MTLADAVTTRPLVAPETHDDGSGPLFEVVDGRKVEKPMSMLAQQTGSKIARRLGNYVEDELNDGGIVGTEHFIACFDWAPKLRRRPDVAYWRGEQYPEGIPPRGDAALPPALAIEVVSPGDEAENLNGKINEYFRAGIELVWTVFPSTRSIYVQQPDGTAHMYRAGETITGEPVLPGFSINVADLFPPIQATSETPDATNNPVE